MIPYVFSTKIEFNCYVEQLEIFLPFVRACEVRPVQVNLSSTDHYNATLEVPEADANAFAVILKIDEKAAKSHGIDALPEEWICDFSDIESARALCFLLTRLIQLSCYNFPRISHNQN